MTKTLITCDCSGSQQIDAAGLAQRTGCSVQSPCSALCTTQLDRAAEALSTPDTIFCCTQESRIFETLAEELGVDAPPTLDLRDRAGWSADPAPKLPKMSALIAEALLPAAPAKSLDVVSEGLCLILGGQPALDAAEQLKNHLGVTVLLTAGDLPDTRDFDVIKGDLRRAKGALGQFEVVIDALQQIDPTGRGPLTLTAPRDGGVSQCDIILDLRGDSPLFPAHEKREGYLRADPTHAPGVAAAVMAASHLVGTFEKPLYVRTEALLCAHSRAEQTGCTRCLDLCPTGAITPNGDHVTVDPMICAGCGACSAACPSGAISYDAPAVDLTMRRVQTLAKAFLDAGGTAPRLLVHDAHGAEMIRLSARHGRGLPADVIPFEISALGAFGHAEVIAALAAGFASVSLLPGPKADLDALGAQVALAQAIGGEAKVQIIDTPDPDAMSDALYAEDAPTPVASPVRPMGTRRQITRQAARALHPDTAQLPLPPGAPYGAVLVDTDACTLCLSCVSLCPSGALADNPDMPQLRFQEDACLQCGLCANICPEKAISLEPRLDLTEAALRQETLNEEEPFACVECGTLFGVKSTIERITAKLQGHSMFQDDAKLRMIQMCDDCRVNAQFHSANNPFQGGERPRPRTTEDYLSKRRDH
ncbi:4Fe-4S binding protein [Tropicibacter naphthalenivorans]|uniref:Pyruvic-ferredoxin oxidoreductase subunit delta n=1 Tax=Tropicibacter naphthalenivorans TaxID=441103 RepID=A0A0P1GGP7_9RHOB|nr:4Fe-4S binding protein [Tropicibacter naphthalenivorans]CUH80771.1 Pyruvic-ferredoxin oxidoreductase subunit delta [Tropicibacter naphthalenivorans]SMC90134.1 4Fe-4S dicluster domain-containing protein [Tropicibacter naphthalenivorans]